MTVSLHIFRVGAESVHSDHADTAEALAHLKRWAAAAGITAAGISNGRLWDVAADRDCGGYQVH